MLQTSDQYWSTCLLMMNTPHSINCPTTNDGYLKWPNFGTKKIRTKSRKKFVLDGKKISGLGRFFHLTFFDSLFLTGFVVTSSSPALRLSANSAAHLRGNQPRTRPELGPSPAAGPAAWATLSPYSQYLQRRNRIKQVSPPILVRVLRLYLKF